MSKLELLQSDTGYRYSIDSFLLADFAAAEEKSGIIDFGTGNGVVPLLLSRKTDSKIIGLEIQPSLLKHAYHNIIENKLGKQVSFIQGDIRFAKIFLKNSFFDTVVSNPPYRKLHSGRLNPNKEKAIARHEIMITLPELLDNAYCLLRKGGKLNMIYLPERYDELINLMKKYGFLPKKIRFIHSNKNSDPKMFLIEAEKKEINLSSISIPNFKNGTANSEEGQENKITILDPLYIYNNDGSYTSEMQKIYDSF